MKMREYFRNDAGQSEVERMHRELQEDGDQCQVLGEVIYDTDADDEGQNDIQEEVYDIVGVVPDLHEDKVAQVEEVDDAGEDAAFIDFVLEIVEK